MNSVIKQTLQKGGIFSASSRLRAGRGRFQPTSLYGMASGKSPSQIDSSLIREQRLCHGTKLQMVEHIEIPYGFFMFQVADKFPEAVNT